MDYFTGEGVRIADVIVDFTDNIKERMELYRTFQAIRDLPEHPTVNN